MATAMLSSISSQATSVISAVLTSGTCFFIATLVLMFFMIRRFKNLRHRKDENSFSQSPTSLLKSFSFCSNPNDEEDLEAGFCVRSPMVSTRRHPLVPKLRLELVVSTIDIELQKQRLKAWKRQIIRGGIFFKTRKKPHSVCKILICQLCPPSPLLLLFLLLSIQRELAVFVVLVRQHGFATLALLATTRLMN